MSASHSNYPGDETARQAFEVMMRRGWYAYPASIVDQNSWSVAGMSTADERAFGKHIHTDPFTALVEAERFVLMSAKPAFR